MPHEVTARKKQLRDELRNARREFAAALPPEVSALVFSRPPQPVLDMVPIGTTIGLYRADSGEAPASAYARFFMEAGHQVALPRVTTRKEPMTFHLHSDPFGESDLEDGPMGLRQPAASAALVEPEVLFMPLVGFSIQGDRLGQGAGYYDRWLEGHPRTIAIGMAWDMQEVSDLPTEPHDVPLTAIVTPTRILGPF